MSTSPSSSRRALLLQTSISFCQSFSCSSPPSPATLISQFFTPQNQRITEHGPVWATERLPFLGKTFREREGCEEYFKVLANVLEILPRKDGGETFPGKEGFVVDEGAVGDDGDGDGGGGEGGTGKGVVCVVGTGRFKAKKTGRNWEEKFIYRLSGFDDEGRIGHWEIWADPLSAWEAVGE